MFSSSFIWEADCKGEEVFVFLRNGCSTGAKVTILKGGAHLDAQNCYLFKKKFSLLVMLKELHLPFTISTNTHAYVQNNCLEACSFPVCRKSNCFFFQVFLTKSCISFIHIHPQKSKYDNQALMKHLTACSTIKGITQRQLYIQNVCTNTLIYKG